MKQSVTETDLKSTDKTSLEEKSSTMLVPDNKMITNEQSSEELSSLDIMKFNEEINDDTSKKENC